MNHGHRWLGLGDDGPQACKLLDAPLKDNMLTHEPLNGMINDSVPSIGLDVKASCVNDVDGEQDSQATGNDKDVVVRTPTSSIPQILQHMTDANPESLIHGRHESFAFSVDGDDSAFKNVCFNSSQAEQPSPLLLPWTSTVPDSVCNPSYGNQSIMSSATTSVGSNASYANLTSPPQNVNMGNEAPPVEMPELTLSMSISSISSIDLNRCEYSKITGQIGAERMISLSEQPKEGGIRKTRSFGQLHDGTAERGEKKSGDRTVRINVDNESSTSQKIRQREKKVGVFRPSSDAYTPRMGHCDLKYKPVETRTSVEKISSNMGTIQRPNFRDALRRVAIILHQHIVKIEQRFQTGIHGIDDTGLFKASMRDEFDEENFATPRYKCSIVRVPMARPGVVYSMRKIRVVHTTPTVDEIYDFAHQLFKKVQLSSECSIVCLIYVEKLMADAKVPLVAETWRPIFLCGLLLASKVWQDLSSWNIEFVSVYPQFSLDAINRLELLFLKYIKWDLYISQSLYAKYYFALRSLLEKAGFRDRYNHMVGGVVLEEAAKVSKRSEVFKVEALQQLSQSLR
jgi:hypothetical protein